jgi:diguanylate cyclase (GGDEF)-like protein/putative nucleotidyltransferase with HDIG domain
MFRVALAGVLALLVSRAWSPQEARVAYLTLGLAVVFGVLLIADRPRILSRERLAHTVIDSALVGALVAGTGGASSPFFPLFFLAALGIVRVEVPTKVVVATAAAVGAYLLATVAAGGPSALWSAPVGLRVGLLVLYCAIAGLWASETHAHRRLARGLASAFAAELSHVERAEGLVSRFGPALKFLSLEGVLQWTAEAAHAVVGGSYAHIAGISGNRHWTVMEGNFDACPSWWHPSIQRLVLQSCREGEVVRSEETVNGIEGFVAVPIGPAGGEKWGAMVLGGKRFGAEEERALRLLAAGVSPALENVDAAPGGLDQLSGLPNRASLRRVLRGELSQGRSLTVLAVGLNDFRSYSRKRAAAAGDGLLRRLGERLRSRQRAFHYGGDEFVIVLGGSDEARARRTALAIRQLVSAETGGSEGPFPTAAVGFAFAGPGDEDPDSVLGAALRALGEARGHAGGVAEATRGSEDSVRTLEAARALIRPLESRDPPIRDHLKAVSRLASLIGSKMSLPSDQLNALALGALLHDVGKIGVPDQILEKPGRLTDEEYEVIKRHPVLGAEMLAPMEELAPAVPAVRYHHERFDGRGYPDGLRGEDIPLVARVVCVADAFDTMARDRPYGYGLSRRAALEEVERNSGTQFDPQIVRALLEAVWGLGDRRANSAG